MTWDTLDIAQDTLSSCKMWFTRMSHDQLDRDFTTGLFNSEYADIYLNKKSVIVNLRVNKDFWLLDFSDIVLTFLQVSE